MTTTANNDSQAKDRVVALLKQLLTAIREVPELTIPAMEPSPVAKYISVERAASLLDIAPNTIRRWCTKEGAPHIRVGRGPRAAIKVDIAELRAWVKAEFRRGEVA